mgnify:CR=1 FL=1
MKGMSRRDFLRVSGFALGGVVVSTGLQGCLSGSGSSNRAEPQPAPVFRQVAFQHGVASGDPLADRVIVWTRVTPLDDQAGDIAIQWEVATDADFSDLLHSGSARTTRSRTS